MDIQELVRAQRTYFDTGATRPYAFRLLQLKKLQQALRDNEQLLERAMMQDFRKAPMEVYMCETGKVLEELRFHLKHLKGWMRERAVPTPLAQFPSKSFVSPEPYGVALIISPWNYPVQLCLSPLVGAISGGNCAVVKPSAYASATSAAIAKLIRETFDARYIAAVEGGRAENSALLAQRFDTIFFTGSVAVGKVVMEAAAKHLTPVTLELGGKSPVIVDKTADLKLAARRIAFGKVLNAGQTCVEPDYLLIDASVKDAFVREYRAALQEFFPDGRMDEMPVIVSEKHFARVTKLLEGQNACIGGTFDEKTRFVAPTLLDGVSPDSPVMQEEIFGPILPMLTFDRLQEAIDFIRGREKPLALYLFTSDRAGDYQAAFLICSGIALQNIPEGLVTVTPMLAAGISPKKTFLCGAATGIIEMIGTFIGYYAVTLASFVLPFFLAFAGGTMLFVISDEMIPETHDHGNERAATYSLLAGFCLMLITDVLLG